MQIHENVPLAPLTTLGVGGPARYFAEARTEADVRDAVEFARSRSLPLFVLGGGSNLLVADEGLPGLVLKIAIRGIEESLESGKRIFDVGAGEDWDHFVARAVAENCAGIECLSGIPGTVGGTPVQNVGAYGQEVSETIEEVRALDLRTNQIRELCNPSCGFAYRTSIFNTNERERFIILRVKYALEPGGQPRISYRDLKTLLARQNPPPSLAETREAVRQIRLSKAMLIVPGDEDCRSAGSFFKNPILSREKFLELEDLAHSRGEPIPSFPSNGGTVKIPAAWLVEHSGYTRGYARGPVGISRKHALAIVNRGGAKASDILALKNEIQTAVANQFGIELRPEPVFLGFAETREDIHSSPSLG
ncbi:MAG TPA: UDP-N-acetylmuramate dehydrogenase [Terriglobales bacterium]|nr:UDP-N-acetylmuramate dehydrogenase [Terriglobales bacterium]